MESQVTVLKFDVPLFDAVTTIVDKEAVLIEGSDGRISGLVTTSDISLQFRSLSESFLLLGEIENHIRRLVDGKYTLNIIRKAIDPSDAERLVQFITDLTLGEYIRLLGNHDNWAVLQFQLDRKTFIKRLDEIRRIRNDVMHFHPDGISPADLKLLRDTVRFMQELRYS